MSEETLLAAYAELKGAQQEQIRGLSFVQGQQHDWCIKQDKSINDLITRVSLLESSTPAETKAKLALLELRVAIYSMLIGSASGLFSAIAVAYIKYNF